MAWVSHPVSGISGQITVPGDKSCSHRALMFGGIAEGRTEVSGILTGDDVVRTGKAIQALGASIETLADGRIQIDGVGAKGLKTPKEALDFGNSGTGSRLMLGLCAGYDLSAEFIGDASLQSRPMRRVTLPLEAMGAKFDYIGEDDRLPLRLTGRDGLDALEYVPPQASAQVKSAILLAGLNAIGTTQVKESKHTRDHTERMLRGFGVEVGSSATSTGGMDVSIKGGQRLLGTSFAVPGDPSSAAFLICAGLIAKRSDIIIENVMRNPTRSGFLELALQAGHVRIENSSEIGGEQIETLAIQSDVMG